MTEPQASPILTTARTPSRVSRSTTGEVTPGEIALCRTRTALALLLHLRMNHAEGPTPLSFSATGAEMACPLSPNAVRDALRRLIEADLVEAFEACPLPRQSGPGRKITRLYAVKPFKADQ